MERLADFRERIRKQAGRSLHCGDRVCDKYEPRHVGRVEAIKWGSVVVVRWQNGWISELPILWVRKAS